MVSCWHYTSTSLKNQDGTTMAYRWPAGTTFKRIDLDVQDRSCPVCGRAMHVCDHRYHHLWTLQGPTQVVNRLVRCPDASCASRGCTFSPEAELSLSMPRWCLGWDVFCWLGHRRFARHWSVPQLRLEITYHPQSGWFEDTPLKGGTEEGCPLKGVHEGTFFTEAGHPTWHHS